MVLAVLAVYNYRVLDDHATAYYHLPNLNEHMQLHEGGDYVC